jgi:hypothetical protein
MDENGAAKVAYATLMNCARVMAKIDAALADAQKAPQPRTAEPGDTMLKIKHLDRALAHEAMLERAANRTAEPAPAPADERQAFEAWCAQHYPNVNMARCSDGYAHTATHRVLPTTYANVQMLWEAWQAARASPAAEPKLTTDQLIAAAEKCAEAYNDDDRPCIKTDVLNAFYAGSEAASRGKP